MSVSSPLWTVPFVSLVVWIALLFDLNLGANFCPFDVCVVGGGGFDSYHELCVSVSSAFKIF